MVVLVWSESVCTWALFPFGTQWMAWPGWDRDQGAWQCRLIENVYLIAHVNKTLILECSPFVINQYDGYRCRPKSTVWRSSLGVSLVEDGRTNRVWFRLHDFASVSAFMRRFHSLCDPVYGCHLPFRRSAKAKNRCLACEQKLRRASLF